MAGFYLPIKSTLDKLAIDIATQLGVGWAEIDDTTNVEEALASPDDLLLYQLVDVRGNDPLFDVQFTIGVKTVTDSANYDLAGLLDALWEAIGVDDTFYIRDYSGVAAPTADLGYFYISEVQTDPQAFDGASGIRLQTVIAKAVKY